jgi:hypothetical protein
VGVTLRPPLMQITGGNQNPACCLRFEERSLRSLEVGGRTLSLPLTSNLYPPTLAQMAEKFHFETLGSLPGEGERYFALISFLRIFPCGFFGRESTNSTDFGAL